MLRVACHFDGHRASDHAQRPRGTPIGWTLLALVGPYWPLLDPSAPLWTPIGPYLPLALPFGPLLDPIGPHGTLGTPFSPR